jgi:hypothetical protein
MDIKSSEFFAIQTESIAPDAITTSKIAPNSVSLSDIDSKLISMQSVTDSAYNLKTAVPFTLPSIPGMGFASLNMWKSGNPPTSSIQLNIYDGATEPTNLVASSNPESVFNLSTTPQGISFMIFDLSALQTNTQYWMVLEFDVVCTQWDNNVFWSAYEGSANSTKVWNGTTWVGGSNSPGWSGNLCVVSNQYRLVQVNSSNFIDTQLLYFDTNYLKSSSGQLTLIPENVVTTAAIDPYKGGLAYETGVPPKMYLNIDGYKTNGLKVYHPSILAYSKLVSDTLIYTIDASSKYVAQTFYFGDHFINYSGTPYSGPFNINSVNLFINKTGLTSGQTIKVSLYSVGSSYSPNYKYPLVEITSVTVNTSSITNGVNTVSFSNVLIDDDSSGAYAIVVQPLSGTFDASNKLELYGAANPDVYLGTAYDALSSTNGTSWTRTLKALYFSIQTTEAYPNPLRLALNPDNVTLEVNSADNSVRVKDNSITLGKLSPGYGTSRPSLPANGIMFFDTSLGANGKPIWFNGSVWVDATGTAV